MSEAAGQTAPSAGPFSAHEFAIAGRYLRASRKQGGVTLVASIAFVAIMLAVFALVAVMSIMNGFRTELFDTLLNARAHIYIQAQNIPPEELEGASERARTVPGVESAGPAVIDFALGRAGNINAPVQVMGVRPEETASLAFLAQRSQGFGEAGLMTGSLEGFGEGRNGGDIILLGAGLARQLRVSQGDVVTLSVPSGASTPFGVVPRNKTYVVGGTFTSGVSDYDSLIAIMPFQQASLFFNREGRADTIQVRVDDPQAVSRYLQPVVNAVGGEISAYDWTQTDTAFFTALQIERAAMRLIMAILIAIASLNIISGLVMLAKNKSRDIAILRTMGAPQASILRIFLIIGSSIGLLGAAAGILLGVLFVINIDPIQDFIGMLAGVDVFNGEVYHLYRVPALLDWGEVLFVSIFCFVTSMAVTLLPAWRAARLDPVEALRYE